MSLPSSEGTVPDRRLWKSQRSLSAPKLPSSDGSVPEILLPSSCREARFGRRPSWLGNVPVMPRLGNESCLKRVSCASCDGRAPPCMSTVSKERSVV